MQQRAKGFLERMNTMTREKRGLDHAVDPEDRPQDAKKQKVPALASVIVEALKVDSLQKLCSSLEPILRRVVSEEVERALAKLGPARLGQRSSPKQIEGPDRRNLQLHFQSRFSLPIFTGGKVEGEQGAAVHVVLLDANTSHVVTSGPESSVKLDVVVLEGDFNNESDDNWTQEDFDCQVVKEREGKRPLLTGDLQVSLKEGVGTLGDLTFTDNSSWVRSRKFRLGLKVASGFCEGIRIREAKTDSFMVKDHRGELYKKHYPPAPVDEVWRLEKIGKDGSFHKRLNKAGIYTVEDFLRLVVRDAQRLRHVLGSGMSNKMWEVLLDHAKTCGLNGKLYVYYPDDGRNVGVVFNNIYELSGLIANGQYYTAETLSDSQKVFVDTLVEKAYDNWMLVVEYDGRALLNLKDNSGSNASQNEVPKDSAVYSAPFDQQVSQPQLPVSMPAEHALVESGLAAGGGIGYGEATADRYKTVSQPSNDEVQFPSSAILHNHLISPSHQIQITANNNTAGPQSSSFTFQSVGPSIQQSNLNSYDDCFHHCDPRGADEFFSEEEIRMRSHEMLENEEMQHMLRIFSMGGTSICASDEVHPYSSYMPLPLLSPSPLPNYGFNEGRSRPSGKGVVGWLKIKALLRWGIFIRRQAAEKRAHLIELDD